MEAFLQHPQQALVLCQSAGRGLGKAEAVKSVRAERKWGFTDTSILAYVDIRAWTENYSSSLPHFCFFSLKSQSNTCEKQSLAETCV